LFSRDEDSVGGDECSEAIAKKPYAILVAAAHVPRGWHSTSRNDAPVFLEGLILEFLECTETTHLESKQGANHLIEGC
jgi:hypothetical protein